MLTSRQKETLDYISGRLQSTGIAPSYQEIADALCASKGNVHKFITALEQRGKIRRLKYRARAIELLEKPVHKETYFLFNDETKELEPWPSK